MPAPLRFLLLTALAAALFAATAPDPRQDRFEIDEAEWLTISIETTRQALGDASPLDGIPPSPNRDPDGNPWKVGIHQSTFGFMNPLLPKFVFGGISLALSHDQYDAAVFPRFAKGAGQGRTQRAKLAVFPPLIAVRSIVTLLAALSAALLFLIAQRIGGWPAGALAFGLFVASPVVADHATRIRTDFFPMTFSLLALWLALLASKKIGTRSAMRTILGLGLLAGLAVGSKLNGALLSPMVGLWILLAWLDNRQESKTSGLHGVLIPWCLAGLATLSLFFLFSPHLWPAPIENLGALMEGWENDINHQKDQYGERLGRADSLGEHFALSAKAFNGEYEPIYAFLRLPLGIPLVLIGLVVIGAEIRRATSRTDAKLILVYLLIAGLGTALWLPFGRNNFYLGFAPVVSLLEGLALGAPLYWWHQARRANRADALPSSTA